MAQLSVVAKKEVNIMEKILKHRQTLQILRGIVFEKLLWTCDFSSLTNLIHMIGFVIY